MKTSDGEVKEFLVRAPVVGVISFVVEAENEEQAIEKAWQVEWRLKTEGEAESEELEMMVRIVSGNVLHASLNEIEVSDA